MSPGMIARVTAGALLVCTSAHAQSAPANATSSAQSVNINVTNTAAHPIPTTVTNTPSVTIANTPSVTIANTPSVTVSNPVQLAGPISFTGDIAISNVPTVLVGNQPGPGGFYNEVFVISSGENDVPGAPGSVVPGGMRRIITSISANWICPVGHNAVVRLHSSTGSLFLPGQFVGSTIDGDSYVMLSQVNVPQRAGSAFQPLVTNTGAPCNVEIYLAGIEVAAP